MTLPIACSLTDSQFQERRRGVLLRARSAVVEVRELENDAYCFPSEGEWLTEIATLVDLERQCCPFLRVLRDCRVGQWSYLAGDDRGRRELKNSFRLPSLRIKGLLHCQKAVSCCAARSVVTMHATEIFFFPSIFSHVLRSLLLVFVHSWKKTGVNPVVFKGSDNAHDFIERVFKLLFVLVVAVVLVYSFLPGLYRYAVPIGWIEHAWWKWFRVTLMLA